MIVSTAAGLRYENTAAPSAVSAAVSGVTWVLTSKPGP